MNTLLAVDPGVHALGWAKFEWNGGKASMLTCGLFRLGDLGVGGFGLVVGTQQANVAIEVPQIYAARKSKGDPNDLIAVALVAGEVAAYSRRHTYIRPHKWKGGIPKTKKLEDYVVHKRNLHAVGKLGVSSMNAYMDGLESCAPSLRHNVADAVGLGIWSLTNVKN